MHPRRRWGTRFNHACGLTEKVWVADVRDLSGMWDSARGKDLRHFYYQTLLFLLV